MKKISIFVLAVLMSLSMLSCDIASPRPNTGTVTIILQGIPDDVAAVSIWCTANEWKADNVNGSSEYITPVNNGVAEFTIKDYVLSVPLQFQFTPMPAIDTKMGDDWWSYAISGSSQYSNNKNNITCDFSTKGGYDGCKVIINSSTYPDCKSTFPIYGISPTRWFTDKWDKCFTVE